MSKEFIPSEIDRKKFFSVFSFCSALLTIIFLIDLIHQKPPALNSPLVAYLVENKGRFILFAILILVWSVISIPLVIASGILLGKKSKSLAFLATIVSTVGILLLGFGVFTYIAAFLSILNLNTSLNQATSEYHAAIWGQLSYYLTDPGLMIWGFGQLLFGWLAWKAKVLPNWLAVIGIIGGIAGLLTLAVYQSSLLALLQISSFAIWGLTIGTILLKRKNNKS